MLIWWAKLRENYNLRAPIGEAAWLGFISGLGVNSWVTDSRINSGCREFWVTALIKFVGWRFSVENHFFPDLGCVVDRG